MPPRVWRTEEWKKNPAMQEALRAALQEPHLEMAFLTLLFEALPRAPKLYNPQPNVSAEAVAQSYDYAFRDTTGFVRFHDRLHELGKPAEKRAALPPDFGVLEKEGE